MKKLVLIGAGGHCNSCIDVILKTGEYEIVAILGKPEEINQSILTFTINGTDEDIQNYINQGCEFLITVGQIQNCQTRLKLYHYLIESEAKIATVISPIAYISPFAKIGKGSIIMHHAMVNANASIGKNCIINTKALIEHDAIIENHCHISTAAVINGNVCVKEESFIGSNAVTKQNITIKPKSFIKAGSVNCE